MLFIALKPFEHRINCVTKWETISDAETGLIKAGAFFMGENGTCHICAFHIAQTLYKTVNTEGMKKHFRRCKMFREFILGIQCTNFLPANEIEPTLNVRQSNLCFIKTYK